MPRRPAARLVLAVPLLAVPLLAASLLAAPLLAVPGLARAQVVDVSDAPPYPRLYAPRSAAEGPRDMVLLGADLVEIAVALGAAERILARPEAVDLPGIEDTPHRMRDWAGVEGILAMRPGLVIASNQRFRTLLDGLARVGVATDLIDRVLPAVEKVRRLAAHLGLEARGEALAAAIEADYAEARTVTAGDEKIRILHASKQGAGGNFSAGGAATAVDNLIARVGALNAAAEIGRDRYRPVTPEGMILMAPDVVIISAAELPAFGEVSGFWQDYPGLALTPAGRAERLVIMRETHVRNDAASSGIATRALSGALAEMFE